MALPVYSSLFAAVSAQTAPSVVATVPAGVIWVVRDISGVFDTRAAAGVIGLEILDPASVVTRLLFIDGPTGVVTTIAWRGRTVLTAGWSLGVGIAGGAVDAVWSGYTLTAP